MIDNLKHIDTLNIVLSKFDDEALNKLYLRVFNSNDGELVLQDLANRCHVYTHGTREFHEGQRSIWLSIQSRLLGAVAIKEKNNE